MGEVVVITGALLEVPAGLPLMAISREELEDVHGLLELSLNSELSAMSHPVAAPVSTSFELVRCRLTKRLIAVVAE